MAADLAASLSAIGGKYAIFVWPAYGASVVAFAWMVGDTLWRGRDARREAERLERDARAAPGPGAVPP